MRTFQVSFIYHKYEPLQKFYKQFISQLAIIHGTN